MKLKIKHVKGSRFIVQSRTDPEKYYLVDSYRRTCTCAAGSYKIPCRHLKELFRRGFVINPSFDQSIILAADKDFFHDEIDEWKKIEVLVTRPRW